jgi:ankyrin repeat protein
MLSDDLSIGEQIQNIYQTQLAQLDHLAFLLDRNTLESAMLTTPLYREEKKLDRQAEIKSLQRNLLTRATSQPQGMADASTLLRLNQEYQEQLRLLKDKMAEDYLSDINQRQSYLKKDRLVELDATKRAALLKEFQQQLEQEMQEYQQFKFTANMNGVHEQQRLDAEIKRCIQLYVALKEQKTQTTEAAEDRRIFLGEKRRQLQYAQPSLLDNPHWNFLKACEEGEINQVKSILEAQSKKDKQVFINQTGSEERNGLHLACGHSHFIIMKYLLQQGANPCLPDSEGYYPLHYAVIKNQHCTPNLLEVLLHALSENKIKKTDAINVKGPYGRTPLHTAALFGNLRAVKWLVEQGAEVNVVEIRGAEHTPLHNAAYKGYAEVVRYLLEHGANPLLLNAGQETALFEALFEGREVVAQVFRARNFWLTPTEQAQLQKQLEYRPAARQCLLRLLQPEIALYAEAVALEAAQNPAAQTQLPVISPAAQLGARLTRLWVPTTSSVSQELNNNNNQFSL